jgi:hypothetical protein
VLAGQVFFIFSQINDYWDSVRTLELYDQTFAQRIGWKWDAVLDYLKRIRWNTNQGTTVDWGCGTGIAARLFARRYTDLDEIRFVDRSPVARIPRRDFKAIIRLFRAASDSHRQETFVCS